LTYKAYMYRLQEAVRWNETFKFCLPRPPAADRYFSANMKPVLPGTQSF